MRLRYVLVISLLAGAVGAVLVGLDLTYRHPYFAGVHVTMRDQGAETFAGLGGSYLIVLVAVAVSNLAAILLLVAAFREERASALLKAHLQSGPSGLPGVRPSGLDLKPESDLRTLGVEGAGGGGVVGGGHDGVWPWGTVSSWKTEFGSDFCDLWNRACGGVYGACPKELAQFEKLLQSAEFDAAASAAALSSEGAMLGAVLALRQPAFEDDGYWWLESPAVIAALLVDPAKRNRGIGRALLEHVERVARQRRRARIFVGGLENFPHLVPGVPDQDQAMRLFFTANGYREIRRTCHMEADFSDYRIPQDLIEREKSLAEDGYTFAAAGPADADAFGEFIEASNLSRKERRKEKFASEWSRYYFALKDGKIVGFIEVTAKDDAGNSGIHLIFFSRPHRGVGLGSVLLNKAHELWRSMGATGGSIWTYPEAASRFYPRAGFHIVQEWVCFEKELHRNWADPEYVNRWR